MCFKFYLSGCYQTFFHGWCSMCNCSVSDPSFGRKNLPYHPYELQLRQSKNYIWHETFLEVLPLKQVEKGSKPNSESRLKDESNPGESPPSPITCQKQSQFDDELKLDRRGTRFSLYTDDCIRSNRVLKIFYQSWVLDQSASNPVGDLIMIHGIAAYGGYLAKLIPYYTKAGFRCHLIDLPNHGRSDGIHVDLTNFSTLIAALHSTVLRVKLQSRQMRREVPLFILGYSLGGLVAINYCLRFPLMVDGLSLVSPCLKLHESMLRSPTVINLARIVAFFLPRLPLPSSNSNSNEVETKEDKSNPDLDDKTQFINDPLTFKGSPRIGTLVTILDQTHRTQKHLERLQTPFFVQQGAEDPVLDSKGAHLLYERSGSIDKLVRIYTHLEHDMFNSTLVIQESLDWLTSQTKRLKSTTNHNS